MEKKKTIKDIFRSFIEWCKDIGGLIKENRMIAVSVLVFVAIVIVAIVVSTAIGRSSSNSEAVAAVVETESSTEAETLVVLDEPLEENAYPEVNNVVKRYYQAMADGDITTLRTLMTGLDEKEEIKIIKKSEYVENYPTVTCYTKKGPMEDSYIVYAYYEVKLVDFENLTPGMNALYLCKNESGAYYINGETQDEKTIAYCEMISAQDDVVDLVNIVQVKYNELKSVDTELSEFLAKLPDILTAAVGEELARREAQVSAAAEAAAAETTEATEAVTEEETQGLETEEAAETVIKTVRTTDVVNVRSSDSATADKIGKAQLGEEYTLLEEKGNGWSKIMFEGKEAFIKTEYLEVVSKEVVESNDDEENEESAEDAAENSPSEGTATVTDTINVRKDASTSADKLGVCYPGEELEVIMKRADGWTEVKYNGKKGFVKSEFLE